MEGVGFESVRQALLARDPSFVELVVSLAGRHDHYPDQVPEGAYTIWQFRNEVWGWGFRWKTKEEKMQFRQQSWEKLEADDALVPLPDRFKLHEIIGELYEADGAFARESLLEIIRQVPFQWGVWRGLKNLFKQTEKNGDVEIYGALLARIDQELSRSWGNHGEVTRRTLGYLSRRGWRHLRRLGDSFPAGYIETVSAVLREYSDATSWTRTWVANHIFHHHQKYYGDRPIYGAAKFRLWTAPDDLVTNRAFTELWRESPRPLFSLLERARSERVRLFAIESLKADFRAELRELDVDDVLRLIAVPSATVHEFAVWLLQNAPRFEQAKFKKIGLHDSVLTLLESPSAKARKYAASYAKVHARDLAVDDLVRLANHDDANVRSLVFELLKERDPRKEIGLGAWGELLGTAHAHELATKVLREHFGQAELTKDWFSPLLLSEHYKISSFAIKRFNEIYKSGDVGQDYFVDLLNRELIGYEATAFALDRLEKTALEALDVEAVRGLLLRPQTTDRVQHWIQTGKRDPKTLGADFFQALSFRPAWERFAWAKTFSQEGPLWARDYRFDEAYTADFARQTLGDVRNFTAQEIGVDWLLSVVADGDAEARSWARDYLLEALLPADFAPATQQQETTGEADLGQKSFLFTGKLSTMTRGEANKKVTAANGKNAKSVVKTLDYLVIGDEGSPLYGNGSKGSKQRKAESLNADGANIAIISETAFLQMLSGTRREAGLEETTAGCERLWEMGVGTDALDDALARFAREFLLRCHDVIGQQIMDRTVEEAKRLPEDFLTFERVAPLLNDKRAVAREFAHRISRWEMARWSPSLGAIAALCEGGRQDVRELFAEALLAADTEENKRLRISPESMDIDGVFGLVESPYRGTRALGMALVDRYPHFADPQRLFALTDSPDRQVRAFVIRHIWTKYRARAITRTWVPKKLDLKYLSRKGIRFERGPGATPPPEVLPASPEEMRDFLRRVLFCIPPARLPKDAERLSGAPTSIAAGKAKRFLLEVLRDLALQDDAFAEVVTPLLQEFVRTLGKSERASCLVALARIEKTWPAQNALSGIETEATR